MYSNPVLIAVLSVLKDTDENISLYKLMQILERSGYDLCQSDTNISDEVKLFRKNFIVMNALYQLKLDLIDSGYSLIISPLKIKLIPDNCNQEIIADDLSVAAALSEYYLDWDNFYLTDKADVKALFDSFWKQFTEFSNAQEGNDKRLDSLQILGLKSSASWEDIQQSYRQLVKIHHPDKGGSSYKFIEIRQAFLILKLTHNMSH